VVRPRASVVGRSVIRKKLGLFASSQLCLLAVGEIACVVRSSIPVVPGAPVTVAAMMACSRLAQRGRNVSHSRRITEPPHRRAGRITCRR